MRVPPASLNTEQELYRPAEMNGKRAKRFCVGHQRKGPGSRTNDGNVESKGGHLFAHGIESGEPIGINRSRQKKRIQRTAQSEQFEVRQHFRLGPPNLFSPAVLSLNCVREGTHDQYPLSGQVPAPGPVMIIGLESAQFR